MIYFVRHGESEANLKGVFAGQRDDSLLTEKGREQARATGLKILKESITIDRIISSPLKRAFETAHIIAREIGIDPTTITTDSRIAEYDMGLLSGQPMKHGLTSIELISAEEAEDSELFRKRIEESLRELSKSPETILVASHGGVGKMLEAIREKKEARFFYDTSVWENASVTKIDWI